MFEILKGHTHHYQHNTWLKLECVAVSAEDKKA